MTIKDLKKWLASLPPKFDDGEVGSFLQSGPFTAKRVIAYQYKFDGKTGIAVNPMGTHYSDEWAKEVQFVSILTSDGAHLEPVAKKAKKKKHRCGVCQKPIGENDTSCNACGSTDCED